MSFSAAQVNFLQRLVSDRPGRRGAGEAARFLCDHYSLGVAVGGQIEYGAKHHEMAEGLLRAHDLPVRSLGADATRADAAVFGGMSEKCQSIAPHARSVAVKGFGKCALDGCEFYSAEGAYTVLTTKQALRVTCQRLMVVENFETFRALEAYGWIDWRGLAVLAVFRGDLDLPNGDAAEVIRSRNEPIWGFFDYDPAGLMMAHSLAVDRRLERLVLPSRDWLRAAADTTRGRQLFDSQVGPYGKTLDQATHPAVSSAWSAMKGLRSAVTQERMLRAK